jgi:S-(hydroxymethyl)glutathione dehydrogenase/alcohol dehydrogenase
LEKTRDLGAETINFDNDDPVDVIKRETSRKGAICIDAVGYEAVGHMAGNASDGTAMNNGKKENHDHSKVANPAYDPGNPLQVISDILCPYDHVAILQYLASSTVSDLQS